MLHKCVVRVECPDSVARFALQRYQLANAALVGVGKLDVSPKPDESGFDISARLELFR